MDAMGLHSEKAKSTSEGYGGFSLNDPLAVAKPSPSLPKARKKSTPTDEGYGGFKLSDPLSQATKK